MERKSDGVPFLFTALWCMVARLDSKSRLASEAAGVGSIPTRVTMKYDNMLSGIPEKPGIYVWTNKLDGKRYVGQASNLHRRVKEHLERFEKNREHKKLYYAMNEVGIENFTISVVKVIEVPDKSILDKEEMFYIKAFNCIEFGYNRTTGGDGGELGCFACDETREKQRQSSIELRNKQRDEGMFEVLVYDIQNKKLYKAHTEEDAARVLKMKRTSLHSAVTRGTKVHKRFIVARTREDILTILNRKSRSTQEEIQQMCNYLKEHPDEATLTIAKKFEMTEQTVLKYRRKLGLAKPKPRYRLEGENVFEGCSSHCAKFLGINPSSFYRALPSYLNSGKAYRGYTITEI